MGTLKKTNESRKEGIKKNKEILLEALEKSLGIVSTACELANISRKTFYNYSTDDPVFKAEVDDIQNVTLDFVESQLLKNIKNGGSAETIFYLKTKGKHRGYIERTENVNVEKTSFSDKTDEELQGMLDKAKKNAE